MKFWKMIILGLAAGIILGGIYWSFVKENNFSLGRETEKIYSVYVVQPDDTLFDICLRYRKNDCRDPYIMEYMDEIRELNPGITKHGRPLQIGDKIILQWEEEVNLDR